MDFKLPRIVSVGIYNTDVAVKRGAVTRKRTTAMFEIELPICRGGTSYIDSDSAEINTDVIICAKPGQTRNTRLPFKCYYIHFILKEGLLHDSLMGLPDFIRFGDTAELLSDFEEMLTLYERGRAEDGIMLQSMLLKLVYNLIIRESKNRCSRADGENRKGAMMESVINYIEENLTSDLSLEAVSSFAGFSPIHFHNMFKTSTGKTLHTYVEDERIKRAAVLLVTTNDTLAKIAYECGFSSQSYFSYAFKRRMGVPPRRYSERQHQRYSAEE